MNYSDIPCFPPLGGAVQKSGALAFDAVRRLIRRSVPKPLYAAAAECADAFWGAHRGSGLLHIGACDVCMGERVMPTS
jgi:hypothetical protein